ncbi:hypothetical protein [Ferruginibacter albus]|uniref:hypothetical protein n=1 Tax=Ferruginibacter albus TaxID=2875540 RepID=UPI001CC37C56|nr:hypothetical protein [Ferruginibacter albus]UAY53341.1 hypothetical protein K9M53_06635 [Ferruginibacter albus]
MNIKNYKELRSAISLMKQEQRQLKTIIHQDIQSIKEELTPSHLFKDLATTLKNSDVVTPAIDSSIGLAAGILTKKAITGKSKSIIRNIAGNLVEAGVSKFVYDHPDIIKKPISFLFKKLFHPKKKQSIQAIA